MQRRLAEEAAQREAKAREAEALKVRRVEMTFFFFFFSS